MVTIVNLSSLLTLKPISTSVSAFAQLCERYSNPSCCNISFINKTINTAWVYRQLFVHQKTLIDPYKLGHISTEEFLKKLSEIFNFVDSSSAPITKEQHEEKIIACANQYFSLQNPDFNHTDVDRALLEHAWGAMIEIQDRDIQRLKHVLKQNQGNPVYLISNTNELHIFKYLSQVNAMAPELGLTYSSTQQANNGMMDLGNQVYLVPSYLQHSYKTTVDNQEIAVTTPDILSKLLEPIKDKSDTIVISHYSKDLDRAQQLGVCQENAKNADDYFSKPVEQLKKLR